tara:strand:- start:1730 stop:2023 length:294 start_codon:yes stop_codon:yes gene_type:complete
MLNFTKGIKLFVSPTDEGFACGVIKEDWMYTEEGYICSVIARGMMKLACDNPQDVFDKGLEGFEDDLKHKKVREKNGHDTEGAEIIDLVPFLNKNVH